jgi:hypothetical protein
VVGEERLKRIYYEFGARPAGYRECVGRFIKRPEARDIRFAWKNYTPFGKYNHPELAT